MKTLPVGELKTHFSEVIDDVRAGEEVVITYGKKKENVAVLIPLNYLLDTHYILWALFEPEKIDEAGFEQIQPSNNDLLTYYQLPKKENHKDPFDRMLIWQAINNGLSLISRDARVEQYIENGLKVLVGT